MGQSWGAGPIMGRWEMGFQNLLLKLRQVLREPCSAHRPNTTFTRSPRAHSLDVSGQVAEGRHGPQP